MRRCHSRVALHSGPPLHLGCDEAQHSTGSGLHRAHAADRLGPRDRRGRSRPDACERCGEGGGGMTSVQVLEWVSRVTSLGIRFRDAATRKTVDDDLTAIVYPSAERELWTAGVINRAGIYVFRGVFGLHAFETANGDNTRDYAGSDAFWNPASPPARYDYTLEVRDPSRRFLPFVLPVKLPQRSLLGIAFNSPLSSPLLGQIGGRGAFVPVFSAPTRTVPEGMIGL